MGISGSEQSVNEEQAALMSLKHGVREGFVPGRGARPFGTQKHGGSPYVLIKSKDGPACV